MTPVLQLLPSVTRFAALAAIIWPLLVLLSWTYDPSWVSALHPSLRTIKPVTVMSILSCGLALWLLADESAVTRLRRRCAQTAAGVASLLAGLTLAEYVFGINIGIDLWFTHDIDIDTALHPGRMAPLTACLTLLLSLALITLDQPVSNDQHPSQYAALAGMTMGAIALVGYLYGVRSLYQVGSFSTVSLYTATLLFLIGLGILAARPTRGFMATLMCDDLGGVMLRRMLPFAIGLPILAGWIRITAQRSGYYDFNFGVALAVAAVMLIMLTSLWVLAGSLNKTDGQKKHILQILQQREARHRLALRAGRMGTFHQDLDNHTLALSPELEVMLGVSAMSFGGTLASFGRLIHPDDWEQVQAAIEEAVVNRGSYALECRVLRQAPLTEAWIAITGQVLPDSTGHPRQITGVMFDITERKRAEATLRESEAHFRMLADATPVLVWMAGPDRLCTWLNRSWLDYTGRALEEELGNGRLTNIHPDDRAMFVQSYNTHCSGHEPFELEYRLRRQDGTYGWILDRGVPLLTETGLLTGYLGAAIDITDRKHAEEQLQRWTVELEKRVDERTRALQRSQSRLRALASDLSTTEQQERRRLATELHDYLAQLLVVGRMKLGQARPQVKDPKAQQLLSETDDVFTQSLNYTRSLVAELSPQVLYQFGLPAALKWLASQMRTHGLSVSLHCEIEHLPMAEERAVILYQSVRELLFNVVKHAETAEASITLRPSPGNWTTITVADGGRGFDPETLLETDRDHPGQFGLFNVQERVEAIGGHLSLLSGEGQGTTVTITVPVETTAPSARSIAAEHLHQSRTRAISSQRLRVLLVDDHAMVRQGLRSVLDSYEDLDVIGEAGDGEAAIALTATLEPDVVVMDINMPKVDGIEATRQILATHPDIVIIGLSVQNERHIEEAMLSAGAAVFVTKERAAGQLYEAIVNTVRAGR
ncbi:MAG: PAS domain-containing protein [Nitrospira sp.]|jgi:PAS domain S-box-containing protein|nr:PAS domain-containing protein [Nitrospira sp.]MCC7470888.1 PAS domain-containing protein [Candidatus Nomurabacteria bacterium]